jgi:hypothetical protein
MKITFDPAKRAETLRRRRIDFWMPQVSSPVLPTQSSTSDFPIPKIGTLQWDCCQAVW